MIGIKGFFDSLLAKCTKHSKNDSKSRPELLHRNPQPTSYGAHKGTKKSSITPTMRHRHPANDSSSTSSNIPTGFHAPITA